MSENELDLVGVREVAEIFGVSKQRVHQLSSRADFPKPVARLRATPVWHKADIEAYHLIRIRRAGRPHKEPATD